MGGSKNRSPAQKEKSQKDSKGSSKKGKKGEKGEGGHRAEIICTLTEEQSAKFIKNAKVITVQELAKQTGVKISAANAFLKKSLEKGTIKKIGGYSNHYIYQLA